MDGGSPFHYASTVEEGYSWNWECDMLKKDIQFYRVAGRYVRWREVRQNVTQADPSFAPLAKP